MKRLGLKPPGPSRQGKDESGFTFVEIMIALTVGAIVIAGMYQGFNILHKWWISSGIRADMRQNARAGLETVTRDLEMAGYQTTNYGDVNKTGLAITLAGTNEIEMDQQQPDTATIGTLNPVYEPRIVYYHLATEMKSGRQNLYRQIRTQPGLPAPDELVAENVSDFTLTYLDRNNSPVGCLNQSVNHSRYTFGVQRPACFCLGTPHRAGCVCQDNTDPLSLCFDPPAGLGPDPLKNIRRVTVTLTTTPGDRKVPFGPEPKPFTLSASVMPQNLAAADEVARCPVPPATPTGLEVIDTQSCGNKLRVRWNHNLDPALAGYRLFYGPTGGIDIPVRTVAGMTRPEVTLNPPNLLITKNADRTTAPNKHTIQILAYDTCGNRGEKSAPVSANPVSDGTVFGGPNGNDTTVNPTKPAPPAALTVSPGDPESGELVVAWPAAGADVVGYRLYRSTTPFTAGQHLDGSLQIAGEAIISAQAADPYQPYRDKYRVSCTEYHYAVAAVNCDETLVAGYHYNGTNAGDYAVASGGWQETIPPPASSLAGSQAAVSRVLITLENPLASISPDFDRTVIYWNKSTIMVPSSPPHFDGTSVSNGYPVPNSDNGSPGTFRNRGSQVIVFDRETSSDPALSLLPGDTYTFLAVSYDRCGNVATTLSAPLTIPDPTECSDNPVGPPPAATGGTISSCEADSVKLGWQYSPVIPQQDLAGFRISRTGPSGTVELTPGPTSLKTWTDAYHLEPGVEYTYTITATDCVYERYLLHYPPWPSGPYPDPAATLNSLTLAIVKPGGLRLDDATFVTTLSDATASYTYHNNVRFSLKNTSRSPVTIKRMSVAWEDSNIVLDKVVIGGPPSSTTERTIDVGGVGSRVEFSVNLEITDVAGGSDAVPLLLRFTTSGGVVNRLVDLRNERFEIALWLGNRYAATAECPTPVRITVDAPRGPELGLFSQSAPGRDGIPSYAVSGPSGTARDTDIKVSTGIGVNVFGTAVDYSRDLFPAGGFATLKVVGADAGAAGATVVPTMPTSGTFDRPLFRIGGDRYAIFQATVPASNLMPPAADVRWYYALVVDQTGNWDRLPNPDHGNYAYAQTAFDVCTHTPKAPTGVVATKTGTGILLTWEAPTRYDDDATVIVADDILSYDVFLSSDGGTSWPSDPIGPNRSSLRYDHSTPGNGTYRYRVRAKNSCQPTGQRVSADSLPSNAVTLP